MRFFCLCDPIAPQTSPAITIAPGCPPDPVTEDTTYLNYRTWKNQTSANLEVCPCSLEGTRCATRGGN